jgi:hypothetical protein
MAEAKTAPVKKPRRDVRVDRLGFVQELVTHFYEPLKEKTKADARKDEQIVGDYFEASLVGTDSRYISPSRLLKLMDDGTITRAELVEMLSVKVAVAEKKLAAKVFKRLVERYDGTPRFTVTRQKGVEVELVKAVRGLSLALSEAEAPSKAA